MDVYQSIGGMVRAELTSADLPSALRSVSEANITCYRTRQEGELTAIFSVQRKDYRKLKKLCEKRGDSLRLRGRNGIYWQMKAFLGRPVLILGILLLLVAVFYLPSRVFFVEVEGNAAVPARQIVEAAESCGIRFGASRREVRSERVKNALLEAVPELQWAGVNTYGCVARISVRERSTVEEREMSSGYGNIVAQRDGVITECTATKGNLLCKPGQAVTKGEVLISGYTDCGICIRLTQAEGEVYGQTLRSLRAVLPSEYAKRTAVGESKRKISLLIGKKRINLWKDSGIYDATCGRMYQEYYITLPGGFRLPVALTVEEYTQWMLEDSFLTQIQGEAMLESFSQSYLTGQMAAGSIRSGTASVTQEDGCWLLEGEYVCVELIGAMQREENGEENGEAN